MIFLSKTRIKYAFFQLIPKLKVLIYKNLLYKSWKVEYSWEN